MTPNNAQALLGAEDTIRYRAIRAVVRALRRAAFDLEGVYRRRTGRLATVRVGTYRMSVPNDMRWAFTGGRYYEHAVADWFPKLLPADRPVFYDVGANAGYYSLLMASCGATVHAFEPVTATRAILMGNLDRNDVQDTTVHRVGLSDQSGSAEIRLFSSSGNNSLFDVTLADTVTLAGTETIQLDRLDDLAAKCALPPPGLVKMDVEGAELLVIRGGASTLRQYLPTIVAEFNDDHFATAGYRASDVIAALTGMGYVLFGLADDDGPEQVVPLSGGGLRAGYGNIIAISPERAARVPGLPTHTR